MSTAAMNKAIAEYFKTQPVLKAWLFGSFARGEETPLSDVDILVEFDDKVGVSLLKHAAMICELEKILDREVEIVPEKMLRSRVRESVYIYIGVRQTMENMYAVQEVVANRAWIVYEMDERGRLKDISLYKESSEAESAFLSCLERNNVIH